MKLLKRPFLYLYLGTFLLFLVYMFFFSDNNLKRHRELNRQIKQYNADINAALNQTSNTHLFEELKNNPQLLEKYGREQKDMHKEDEDVFIIVYD